MIAWKAPDDGSSPKNRSREPKSTRLPPSVWPGRRNGDPGSDSGCFGLVPLFARNLQAVGTDSATISFYRYAASALILLPWLPLRREKRGEALVLGGAGLLMGLSWIGYLEAIKVASVAAAGSSSSTAPSSNADTTGVG